MTENTVNDRGEYMSANGKLWHGTVTGDEHPGEWLKCDLCNPLHVVRAPSGTDLEHLRMLYADAKAAADAAAEQLKTAKNKLQTALAEVSEGAYRAVLYVDGYKPVNLYYSEPWRLDSKRLQAEQPALYVEYAKRGSQWTMSESRGS